MKIINNIIKTRAKEINLRFNEKSYVSKPCNNLVEAFPNWKVISDEISKGMGNELKKNKNNQTQKFCSIFSSSALCVNNFALIKQNASKINFLDYGYFDLVIFEGKVSTGISSPNLDVLMENENYLCGVESKFTEYFSAKIPDYNSHGKPTITNYKNRISKMSFLPDNFEKSLLDYYINKKEKLYLDVAQLIKHSIGLINEAKKKGKKPVLVYIYWEPQDKNKIKKICENHEEEIKEFKKQIKGFIEFEAISYPKFWNHFENDPILKNNITKNRARYLI